ncbi:MAG: tetratricopeptide repeat protein [Candidatus Hodarchaeales archaeon]|jgi:tetratricopeptide (TPR) repeat protein
MNLQKKILFTFISLLVVPVVFLAAISGIEILLLSEANSADSSDALIEDNLDNLVQLSSDEGIFIDETFKAFSNEITMLDSYTENLFNNDINITPSETYYWNPALEFANTGRSIPGYAPDLTYGIDVSFDTSCYYLPREQMQNSDPFDLSSEMQTILDTASNMDNMFKNLHEANPEYIWIYAGFEGQGHLFKNYPYADMSWCYDYEYYEGTPYEGTDYDPWIEEWYQNAAVVTDNTTAFTSPYFDPDVGLIISIGRPARYVNGSLIGVVSADITITAINDNVLGLSVLDNGYAYLLDNNGNVISHPNLDQESEEVATIDDLEFGSEASSEKGNFQSIVTKMTSGLTGLESFFKGGKRWYISYVPIATTEYSLAVVVPESDIVASAVTIKNTISGLSFQQTILFLIVLSIVVTAVIFVGTFISNKIVQPVRELTSMVNFIAEGDLSRDLRADKNTMGKEIATLHSAFDNLLTSLRFGNTDYYRGDLQRAYQNYQKALELFKTTKNDRGIAIATNNLGNIYRAWNDFERAKSSYGEAIRIGDLQQDKKGLASRFNNLGLLYMDKKNYDLAMQMLNTAKQHDEEIRNYKGLVTRIGNIGIIQEKLGNYKEAETSYKEAIALAEKHNDTRGLASSYLKYAVFHIVQENFKDALKYLKQAFELAKSIDDVRLALNCLDRLENVYDELDRPTESHKTRISAEKIRKKIVNPKIALFVLDYSGSMQGNKMHSLIRGTVKLFEDRMNPQDKVGVVIFNSRSHTILPLTLVEGQEKLIKKKIRELRYPQGATAFYDALGEALVFLNREKGNEQKWLIALTDGEDNSSQVYEISRLGSKGMWASFLKRIGAINTSIPDFIDENLLTTNILIVGVGPEVRVIEHDLVELCNSTPRGKYIDVSNPRVRIEAAIEEAFTEIQEVMGEVDVEGFDISDV